MSKNIGYLGCEFKMNEYFRWAGADRLGQFTVLAFYALGYMCYMYAYIIFPIF